MAAAAAAVYRPPSEKRATNKQDKTDRQNILSQALPARAVKHSFRNSDKIAGPEDQFLTTVPESSAHPGNFRVESAAGDGDAATAQ